MIGNRQVRLGVIGAGNIGQVHMEAFSKLSDACELTAISDVYLPSAESSARHYGIPHVAQTPEELLRRADVDAVVIAVPNQYHAPLAIQALQAGKHVLVEKPMGLDAASSRLILDMQRQTGKTVMVAHQRRWQHVPMMIKAQADRGEFGRIYAAKASWFRRKGIPGWGTWFTRKAQSGGGPLIDLGVHLLDLALYLMGDPKPVSVYGSAYAEFGPKRKGIGEWGRPDWSGTYDVEDLAMAIIRMEDGSALTLDVSWAAHVDTDNQPTIHLLGTEGGACYRGSRGKLFTEKFDRPIELELQDPEQDEGDRIRFSRYFLSCIREGKEPICSALTGYTNNLILDALYESSRTGREVRIDPHAL